MSIRVSHVLELLYPGSLDYVEDHHLDRGTRLHKSMEVWGFSVMKDLPLPDVYEECVPVCQWLIDHQFKVIAVEAYIESKLGYHGHPDLLAEIDSRESVVDYKFSETITEMNKMQMEAYCEATKLPGIFLQCGNDGTVKAIKHKRNAGLLSAFLSGVNVLKFLQKGQ